MENKITIRNLTKRKRSSMPTAEVAGKSEGICRKLMDNQKIQQADMVFVYAALGNEVDLRLFVEQCWQMGKVVAFPRCEGDTMEFYQVDCWDNLEEGNYHIQEPKKSRRLAIPGENTVVCVPGIAFSNGGDRIGMGKGYYDKYLSRYPKLYKIGLAFELQMEYSWTPDTCDIPMDLLISELREVRINER